MGEEIRKHRIVIGISGATGIIYGQRLLEIFHYLNWETHLVISKQAQMIREYETTLEKGYLESLATFVYKPQDFAASISSGSFRTEGMIIAPCSIKSVCEIATGVTTSLLTRAADVVLKEKRKLVLMVRETPLHQGHLEALAKIAMLGGIIAPPVPAFYHRPQTIQDIVDQSIGRVLDLFDIDVPNLFQRWNGLHC